MGSEKKSSLGAFGCAMSHRTILLSIVNNDRKNAKVPGAIADGTNYVAIFEDAVYNALPPLD